MILLNALIYFLGCLSLLGILIFILVISIDLWFTSGPEPARRGFWEAVE